MIHDWRKQPGSEAAVITAVNSLDHDVEYDLQDHLTIEQALRIGAEPLLVRVVNSLQVQLTYLLEAFRVAFPLASNKPSV